LDPRAVTTIVSRFTKDRHIMAETSAAPPSPAPSGASSEQAGNVTQEQIVQAAERLGQLVAQHPAVARYKQAQQAVAQDPEASRLLADFDRQLETLARQEQSGMSITDAQRQQLENLQSRIMSHLKVKNLNMAQVDFMDLLRKVSQAWQGPLASERGGAGAAGARVAGGPRM
jgi:cell fate (sporulation/competence/biofilm development) regulator YlbF (YheA/YmcA/DUF963 family)